MLSHGIASARSQSGRAIRPLVLGILSAAVLAACSGKDQGQQGAGANQLMPVGFIEAKPTTEPVFVEAVGQTEGSREVEVRARVGGILEKRLYEEGNSVKAGQPLFLLDRAQPEAALQNARAAVAEAQSRLDQATREVDRNKGLAAQDAVSRKDLDDALSAQAAAKAQLQAAQATASNASLNVGYTEVIAPVSGISGRALRNEGNLISIGDELTTVIQADPIKVRFGLSATDQANAPGGRIDWRSVQAVELVLPDGTKYNTRGTLDFAATQIDPRLGTRSMRAVFSNPRTEVLPGQFVKVRLQVGTKSDVFRVPQAAVLQTDQAFLVMVATKNDKGLDVVAPRPVQPGPWDGKDWLLYGGLQPGDRVLVDNLIKLRPGMPIQPVPAGAAPGAAGGAAPGGQGGAPAAKPAASAPAANSASAASK
ncbi:efflux RND transporter periplasmic adaptor subunit [Uliginosibacterium sp. sgz301328]|uniref:efflux RND transporter periplasmic adaptor subunit n=1 Tax=Uliginosibacterium sp. sgz301328 TaxID=3243764 RepID=UPI00359D933D